MRDTGLIYRRMGAFALDALVTTMVAIFVGSGTGAISAAPDVASIDARFVLWTFAMDVGYRWAFHSAFGATLGKLALGLRLVDRDGKKPGPVVVLGREVLLFALLGASSVIAGIYGQAVAYGLNSYVVFRRHDQRAIHDLPVGTRVVRAVPIDEFDRGGGPLRPRMP